MAKYRTCDELDQAYLAGHVSDSDYFKLSQLLGCNKPLSVSGELKRAKQPTLQQLRQAVKNTVPKRQPQQSGVGGSSSASAYTGQFTPGQLTFIDRFAADTGLDKNVVAAWVYNEQNGSAAWNYENRGFFNWLNIGVTDSGSYGTGNSFWGNPTAAADASATWLQGGYIPGFGYASSGIRRIAQTVGMSPAAQISAIQNSGWASSHYPNLPSIYASLAGKLPKGKRSEAGLFGIFKNFPMFPGIPESSIGAVTKDLGIPNPFGGVEKAVTGAIESPFKTAGKYIMFAVTIAGGGLLLLLGLALVAADVGIEQIREPRPVRGVRRQLVRAKVAKPRTSTSAESVGEARARREAAESRRVTLHAARVKTEQARATELRSRSRARNKQIRITKEEKEKIKRQGYMEGFADREHHEEKY